MFLYIPNELKNSLVIGEKTERDAINELHADVFDGSHIMWGEQYNDFYAIELSKRATKEQIQDLIDKIERAGDK